jgi:DNA-directed RNA polymerase specialized sigma24 family protein
LGYQIAPKRMIDQWRKQQDEMVKQWEKENDETLPEKFEIWEQASR